MLSLFDAETPCMNSRVVCNGQVASIQIGAMGRLLSLFAGDLQPESISVLRRILDREKIRAYYAEYLGPSANMQTRRNSHNKTLTRAMLLQMYLVFMFL